MRLLEGTVFLTLAGAMHVAALTLAGLPQSGTGGGAEGDAALTLRAAPGALSELVQSWERPPDIAAAPSLTGQPVPQAALLAPRSLLDPAPRRADPVALAPAEPPQALPLHEPRLPALPGIARQAPAAPQAPSLPEWPSPFVQADPAPQRAAPTRLPQPRAAALPDLEMAPPAADVALPAPPSALRPPDQDRPLSPPAPPAPADRAAAPLPLPDAAAQQPPSLPETGPAPAPAAPVSAQAPATSLRPALRPDTLVPAAPAPRQSAAAPKAKPRPAPAPKAAPRPAQRAAGAGGGGVAAQPAAKPKPKPAPGANKAAEARAEAQWQAGVARAAQRAQRYPRGTRDAGTVRLRFALAPSGKLLSASITRSSGSAALDRAALQTLQRARFPRAPKGFGRTSASFAVSLKFAP